MVNCVRSESVDSSPDLSDEQKRQLRAVRRGYRAESVSVKNDGWDLEIRFMDGSSVMVSSKAIKLKKGELRS
jgi:hypothetical protein